MSQPTVDWSIGHYEATAVQLLPASRVVVEAATLSRDDRVLDIGCGTGNAALLAADHTSHVIGVDPAARLLEVAQARAAAEGKTLTLDLGEAAALPVDDASVDVALSVFGLIFAPDPEAAAAEISRVLTPSGRVVLSAWIPGGAISEMNGAAAEAVRKAVGAPPPPPPFAWHDRDRLDALFGPHGFRIDLEQHQLAFTAESPQDFMEGESRDHPLAVAGMAVLEQLGQAESLRARLLEILENGNEDPEGFRATSRYVVATARREA